MSVANSMLLRYLLVDSSCNGDALSTLDRSRYHFR